MPRTNWIVIAYDADDQPAASFIIRNRTEDEASREAEHDVRSYADWSMMPIDKYDERMST